VKRKISDVTSQFGFKQRFFGESAGITKVNKQVQKNEIFSENLAFIKIFMKEFT
jgi:hypothetical protein